MTRPPAPSERVRVRRLPDRGAYDRATIDAILDAQPMAHVGWVLDGAPMVTPTLQWREGDHVYWHGSAASRMLDRAAGAEVCVTVTILDGLVLARSAFHHSANYRSVMLLGRATLVEDPDEKAARLRAFTERLYPGRWDALRPMTAQELKGTDVLSLAIDEASAKIRTGPPKDDAEDLAHPVWAGVLPVTLQVHAPVPDPRATVDLPVPAHASGFRLG